MSAICKKLSIQSKIDLLILNLFDFRKNKVVGSRDQDVCVTAAFLRGPNYEMLNQSPSFYKNCGSLMSLEATQTYTFSK